MIELRRLSPEEYERVYEMDQCPSFDFASYVQILERPNYLNFGIYQVARLVGAITIERTAETVARFHVAKEPRTIKPAEMATILRHIAGYLFQNGFEILEAAVSTNNRAAARLALRCRMTEVDYVGDRLFQLTKEAYEQTETGRNESPI